MNSKQQKQDGSGVNRREFVQAAVLAGAGAVFSNVARGEDAPGGGGKPVNIALIGAGRQGRECLTEAILKIPGIQFKAICDIWEYNRNYAVRALKKRKHEVTGYEDYKEMLEKEKDIDAVVVASPDFVHAEHTCAALKAGKHVYCEKVMARTADECKKMVEASRETKKLLQIGHQRYSNPRYLHCKDKLLGEAKLLGRITTCYGQWNRSKRPDFTMPKNAPEIPAATLAKFGFDSIEHFLNWRYYKKYGNGPIADLGAHQIGVFGWLLGVTPKAVMASGAGFYKGHEWSDNVLTILEYDTPTGPVQAFYQVLTTTGSRGYFETFMGEDGSMTISEDPAKCRIYSEGHLVKEDGSHPWEQWIQKKYLLREQAPKEDPKAAEGDVVAVYKSKPPEAWLLPMGIEQAYHLAHLQNFFDAVRNGTPLTCPGEVGYANAVGVFKINEAVAAGKKLEYNAAEFKV